MPFYSGKDGVYPEKQKFYLENDVFQSTKKLEMPFYSRKAGFYQ